MGFGNIAGVATAVTTGGPGAVLWMWLTAFMGMLIKQVEVTLAVYYRRTDEEGNPYGGPTYYMEYGLGEERHWGKKWLPLAFVFGLGIFSTFFISASNFTTSEVLAQSFGIPQELASLLLVVFIYALIWRGVKNLSKIFVKLVPVMSLGYLIFGLVIIVLNIGNLIPTIGSIFTQAFTGTAAMGLNVFQHNLGFFGTVFMTAAMVIFSVTTSGGWYVYYEATLRHLAMNHPTVKKWLLRMFKYFYALPPFLLTLYLIHVGDLSIWTLVDITSGIPTFINVFVQRMVCDSHHGTIHGEEIFRDHFRRNMCTMRQPMTATMVPSGYEPSHGEEMAAAHVQVFLCPTSLFAHPLPDSCG